MFIATLFTTSQDMEATSKSINRRMDKEDVVHIYTMEYYSGIKKNKIMPFAATWMDLQSVNSEWSKSYREGEISNDIPYMWNLKRTYFQNRKTLIDLENKLMWEGIVKEFGKVMYTLLNSKFKIDKQQRHIV